MNKCPAGCDFSSTVSAGTQNIILIVEDEKKTRRDLQTYLQKKGYTVIGKNTVEDAEDCITEVGIGNIGLIVSGIKRRPLSQEYEGYAFFIRQISRDPELPFILISDDYAVRELPAVRSKDVSLLAKPFKLLDVLAAVQALMGKPGANRLFTR